MRKQLLVICLVISTAAETVGISSVDASLLPAHRAKEPFHYSIQRLDRRPLKQRFGVPMALETNNCRA